MSKTFRWALRKLVITCQHEMLDFWKTTKQEVQILDSAPAAIWVELITASVCKCFTCGWRVTHNPDRKTEEGQQPMETAVRMMFCNSGEMLSYLYCFICFFYAKNVCMFCILYLRWNQTWFALICWECCCWLGVRGWLLELSVSPAHPTLKPLPTIPFLTIRLLSSLRLQSSGFGKCASTCVSHVLSRSAYSD